MCQDLSKLPTSLVLSSIMLFHYFGFSFVLSLIPFFVSIYFNKVLAKKRKVLHKEKESRSDEKSNKINETLNNAKMIKLYGWQDLFRKNI